MKFLTMGMPGPRPVPAEMGVSVYEAAKLWIHQRIDEGKIECVYIFPDRGGFAISNAESHEEVMEELLDYPLYPFFKWEVKPLVHWEKAYDAVIALFEKMAAFA